MNRRPFPLSALVLGLANLVQYAHEGPRAQKWARNAIARKQGSSKYTPHQGDRECARRRAQMAKRAELRS